MTELTAVSTLSRDLAKASVSLGRDEARFLVKQYYRMQDNRKRANNQAKALGKMDKPHGLLTWLQDQNSTIEAQIKRALAVYVDSDPVGRWMISVYGIGPVLAAGFLANFDIKKAETAGAFWTFAGINGTEVWEKGQKRPWSASAKVLTWKAGQSFMKFSGREECYYGKLYLDRKAFEVARNESGGNQVEIDRVKASEYYGKTTQAWGHIQSNRLPPSQIDGRARRWAVKIFMSHLHQVWYQEEFKRPAPVPFAIAHLGHAHFIPPAKPFPHVDFDEESWVDRFMDGGEGEAE